MTRAETIQDFTNQEYKWGFITQVDEDRIPKGLNEDVVRLISAKKEEPEFLLEWRLKAYRHWASLEQAQAEPKWSNIHYDPIDYQNIVYYSAPKQKPGLNSLNEVDPEMLKAYEKLGISLGEQKRLSGVAVDAVFDSVSVATTFKEKLAEKGVIFCSFSEAVRKHPALVEKYLGSVVPYSDNFFATLNSAVFSDGSFVYVPKGVRCPMELSTYFRINAADTGQFERTLIVADEGAYVSYLEGCTAPVRDGRRAAIRYREKTCKPADGEKCSRRSCIRSTVERGPDVGGGKASTGIGLGGGTKCNRDWNMRKSHRVSWLPCRAWKSMSVTAA